MRKQWILSLFLIGFLILPSGYVSNSTSDSPQFVNIAQVSDNLPRVYGENFADDVYSLVNLTNIMELVREFSELGPRYIMTYGDIANSVNEQARYWLIDEMTALSNGRIQIQVNGTFKNIIGCLPGYLPDENDELPVFIISAHYDSRSGSPGANTDGSGIAVMLELIRILSAYEWPLDIMFIAFNGEHAIGGLLGSKELSNQFLLNEVDILAMYNVDTILIQDRYASYNERVLLAYNTGGRYWAEIAKTMCNYYGGDIIGIHPANEVSWWGTSSNYHFAERGYDNILFAFESGYAVDSISGTQYDVSSRREFSYYIGRETTAFIGASIAFTMSREYGKKTHLFDTRIIGAGAVSEFYIPITTPTYLNITCRWYNGGANFMLEDPTENLINHTYATGASPWAPSQILSYSVTSEGLYKLNINNYNSVSIGVDVYIEYESDIDHNGVIDSEEYWLNSNLFKLDSDSDSISDALEIIKGLDPLSNDSDNDSMPDAYELDMGFDPLDAADALGDADNDTLSNLQEYTLGLNPFSSDSDGDKMSDPWEVANGLNPLVDDANENPDHDKYTNIEEYLRGSDPNVADVEPIPIIWVATPIAALVIIGIGVIVYRRG